MAATPEGKNAAGAPVDPEAALRAAEAAHLAARDTVPVDVRPDPLAQRETVRLPTQRGSGGGRVRPRRAPLVLAAGVATALAVLISAAPVVLALALAQVTAGGGSPIGVLRVGLAGWLLGHGVPLDTEAGRLELAPLGLAALAAWRVIRAGVHTTRGVRARHSGSPRRALAVAGAVGIWYGLFGGIAALVVGDGGAPAVSAARAVAQLTAFGLVFGLVGAAGTTGALDTVAARVPQVVRDGVRIGVVSALLLLGASAAAAGISLALGGGEASDVFAAYRTGVAGQAGITLVCLAYAPNSAVWAAAYLIGPGFSMGTDTIVRVTDVAVGSLPAIPLFAGLPAGPVGAAAMGLLGVPVAVGVAGGLLLSRRLTARLAAAQPVRRSRAGSPAGRAGEPAPTPSPGWPALLGGAVVAGPVAGALLGAAAFISAGSLGAGRLSQIGPVAWQVAAIGAGVVTLGAVIGVVAARAVAAPKQTAPQ